MVTFYQQWDGHPSGGIPIFQVGDPSCFQGGDVWCFHAVALNPLEICVSGWASAWRFKRQGTTLIATSTHSSCFTASDHHDKAWFSGSHYELWSHITAILGQYWSNELLIRHSNSHHSTSNPSPWRCRSSADLVLLDDQTWKQGGGSTSWGVESWLQNGGFHHGQSLQLPIMVDNRHGW